MSAKLQVALDLMNLERALNICRSAVAGGVDIIEAGTPLIKSEGMDSVRKLKESFPDKSIFADMKTMDVGGVEVEIAAKAGADIIGILGASDDETIKEGIRSARNYDAEIMVDMIRVDDIVKRTKEVCEFGADYIGVHVGIDAQMRGEDPLDIIGKVAKVSTVPIAVAGGINSETAPAMIEKGAQIIIVGGAIIKAKDVKGAAQKIKRSIETGEAIESEITTKFSKEKISEALRKVSTPNISDAMHREPCMDDIKQTTSPGSKMIGKAFTVRTVDGDWAKPVEAIEKAEKGDVIVIDAGGGRTAVWGELSSRSCKIKGVKGVVIDGAVRDVDEIKELNFPIYAKYSSSNAGEPKGYGGLQDDIVCGGVEVKPGDWIVGDDSGVMVIPKEEAHLIANRAVDVLEKENRIREEIKEGKTLSVVMELERWEKK